jgi:hypothetical protein
LLADFIAGFERFHDWEESLKTMEFKDHGSIIALKCCTQCPSRYFALHLLKGNSVYKVAIVSDKKISRNECIVKDLRTVKNRRENETAYHITNQEEDELFRLESCPCDLQTAVNNFSTC